MILSRQVLKSAMLHSLNNICRLGISNKDGNQIVAGSQSFQSSGANTQFPLLVKHFFDGSNFYFVIRKLLMQQVQS